MAVKLKVKIGSSVLECQANDMKMIHEFSSVWGMLPQVCDNCKGQNLALGYKSPKNFKYYTLVCRDCKAELIIRQKQEGGWYIKNDEKMTVYNPEKKKAITTEQVEKEFSSPDAQQTENAY